MQKGLKGYLFSWLCCGLMLALTPGVSPGQGEGQIANDATDTNRTALELERLNIAYFEELGKLRNHYETSDKQLLEQYRDVLTRFARESQTRGDLEAWQAGDTELKRLAADGGIARENLTSANERLRSLQERALRGRATLRQNFARETIKTTDLLVARFEQIKKNLTIAGDADGARLADGAAARAHATEAYTEALFALDDAAGEETAAAAQPAPAPPQIAPALPEPPSTTPLRIPNSAGIRVYEPGYVPSSVGVTYRLCSLTETENSPKDSPRVAAVVRYAPRDNMVFKFPNETLTADAVVIRLSLRARGDNAIEEPVIVVAEYFGCRINGAPQAQSYLAINMASLSNRSTSIDLPTTPHQIQIRPNSNGGVRRRLDKDQRFGGIILTVFDRWGTILYQAVTDSALLPHATDSSPYMENGILRRPMIMHKTSEKKFPTS